MATIQDIQDKQNEAASAVSGVPPPLMTIDEEELQQPTIATNIAANKALSQVIIDPRQEFETLYQEALLSDTGTMSAMADLLQEYDSSYNVNKVIHEHLLTEFPEHYQDCGNTEIVKCDKDGKVLGDGFVNGSNTYRL